MVTPTRQEDHLMPIITPTGFTPIRKSALIEANPSQWFCGSRIVGQRARQGKLVCGQ
jgi:hypothetical protein